MKMMAAGRGTEVFLFMRLFPDLPLLSYWPEWGDIVTPLQMSLGK